MEQSVSSDAVGVDYASPGRLTALDGAADVLAGISGDAVEVCMPVHQLVIQPGDAQSLALPEERFEENQMRPAQVLLARLLRLDPARLVRRWTIGSSSVATRTGGGCDLTLRSSVRMSWRTPVICLRARS